MENINQKQAFISVLRQVESGMRVDPKLFKNNPDMTGKFCTLCNHAHEMDFTDEERSEIADLWDSIRIVMRGNKSFGRAKVSRRATIVEAMKDAIRKWRISTPQERLELIRKARSFNVDGRFFSKMSPEQLEEYNFLLGKIRTLASSLQPSDEVSVISTVEGMHK